MFRNGDRFANAGVGVVLAVLAVVPTAFSQSIPYAEDLAAAEIAAAGQARLIVQFRTGEPAALTRARERSLAAPGDAASRRSAVAEQRAAVANGREALSRALTGRGRPFREIFDALPYAVVDGDAATLEMLRRHPDVAGVFLDQASEPLELTPTLSAVRTPTSEPEPAAPANSRDDIRARDVWAQGFTGQGFAVALLDSGVDATHPMFAGKVVAEACYATTVSTSTHTPLCPNGTDQQTGAGAGTYCPSIEGRPCSHGSHVAGIAAGNDPGNATDGQGVAPGANLISIQIFTRIADERICTRTGQTPVQVCLRSYTSDQIAGLNQLIGLAQSIPIAAVNMSFSGDATSGTCDTNPLKGAIDVLRGLGIASVISAGNDAKIGQMGPPACISTAISVGAVGVTAPTSFTNVSTLTDMMAPGSSIRSAALGGGYATASGTSMSAPHIAGALAVLKSARPAASVALLEAALKTGPATTIPTVDYTVPRLELLSAYNGLASGVVVANGGTVVGGVTLAAANGSQSLVRVYNPTASPGRVSAVVRDGTTGAVLGTWQSPSLAGRSAQQFTLQQITGGLPGASGKTLTLGISGTFAGYAQHLSLNTAAGLMTNISGCDNGLTALPSDAPGLSADPVMGLASALMIANTGGSATAATFDIYRAGDGISAGVWTSASVPAQGTLRVPFSTIVASIGIASATPGETFVARLRAGFTGFVQHVGVNGGVTVANLSAACPIKVQ